MSRKKIFITAALAFILSCCVCIAAALFTKPTAAFAETIHVEGETDTFVLTEESYGKDEKFVFASTVNFNRGQAAGLVFGAVDGEHYWVFNIDRAENLVKLLYFNLVDGQTKVENLEEEYYVGPSIMNEGERDYVKSRTANIDKVYLKVIVNADSTAEFYADGIRRFCFTDGSAEAATINLGEYETDGKTIGYEGGALGYNCFNGAVDFGGTTVSQTDYTYYSELYRNEYHFSQYAHWNNDPNGLVYYNGYYHLYYQHNPYGNTWDAMHWGHARSRDLVHWEHLPIALVPDRDLAIDSAGHDHGIGAMWSGSARVYHKGDSAKIDNEYKWFNDVSDKAEGEAVGLIGFYTRFDDGGNRHQIIMYSADGGLTWNKRDNIPCTVSRNLDGSDVTGGSWRDPKVFDISSLDGVGDYKWGMALTDMEDNTLFFLKSKDMISWEHAGSYFVYRPECPDVVTVKAEDNTLHTVITFTSRYYVVCDLAFEGGMIVMKDLSGNKITRLDVGDPLLQTMDYGVDSYACQTFYIDFDSDSAYAGKQVALSWFSGVPNADASIESGVLQSARKVWNGGGMTIPVIYGLKQNGSGYVLTTTPITTENPHFEKTPVVGEEVSGHCLEIKATITNTAKTPVYFRVNGSSDGQHYTEIGWNSTDGYYVDRIHTEDAGIAFPQPNYALKYASGKCKEATELDFYILVDNNNVEVYCDGYTIPFYILTFASPYSDKVSFYAESEVEKQITYNKISSVWKSADEGTDVILSQTEVELGTSLTTQKEIFAYACGGDISWTVESGESVAEVIPTGTGAVVKALTAGECKIKVQSGSVCKIITVTVHEGNADSDLSFSAGGIVSGDWYYDGDKLVGSHEGDNGFLLAEESGADFVYSANFNLGSGAAAALVFRAEEENGSLKSYLIANYDNPGKVVKLWSQDGLIKEYKVEGQPDLGDLALIAEAQGRNVKIYFNNQLVIDVTLGENEPTEGRFGLNVCATRASFNVVSVITRQTTYAGEGDLRISLNKEQTVYSVTNLTAGNIALDDGFYKVEGRKLIISSDYFELLPQAGTYSLLIKGSAITFVSEVTVSAIPLSQLKVMSAGQGTNVVIYLGNNAVDYVKINGEAIATVNYAVKDRMLSIDSKYFNLGTNSVQIGEDKSVSVNLSAKEGAVYVVDIPAKTGLIVGLTVGGVVILLAAAGAVVLFILLKKRSKKATAELTAEIDERVIDG